MFFLSVSAFISLNGVFASVTVTPKQTFITYFKAFVTIYRKRFITNRLVKL